MRRLSLVLAVVAVPAAAVAEPTLDDDRAVALAAELAAVSGGGTTPGGLRVAGRYLYRLAERDWFDGSVGFTYGGDARGCGMVGAGEMTCDHGVAEGFAGDLALGVRRDLGRRADVVPYARGAVFGRVLRFAGDDVTGAAIGGEVGVGLRIGLGPGLAVTGGASGFLGVAHLDRDIGAASQLGLSIGAAAEFRMR